MKKIFKSILLLTVIATFLVAPVSAGLNDRFTDLVNLISNYIEFEGATKDQYETKLVPAEPTADRTITLPNISGTVVTTGDTGSVTSTIISDGTIATADVTDNAITSAKIAADVIVADDISTGAVTTTEILDGTVSAADIANVVRYFQLPLNGFVLDDATPVSGLTAPGFEIDDLIPNIVWADAETTPIVITFVIPEDYASGGAFKVLATESDSTTPNQIDFDVYVNSDGVAADASATGQTPVALAGTTSTPDMVTLTPATDFAALAAGQWVTLRIWRDDAADGTGDLEIKGVTFFYTATQ